MSARAEALVVEERGWPVVIYRLPPLMTVETVRALAHAADRIYDRRERFASVVDLSAVKRAPDAAARTALTDWMGDPARVEKERAYMIAMAIVLASGPLRALAAAVQFVRPPSSPQQFVATLAEAITWVRQRLHDAGVPMTAGADALSSFAPPPHSRPGA